MKKQKDDKKNKRSDSGGEIERQLKKCQKLEDEYLNGWKRARADFLNYKKEETERIAELIKYGNEEFILKLLPILDSLHIAEKELPKELKNNQWAEGILETKNQILDFLKNQGIEEIKSLGEEFNPSFHEAVEAVEKNNHESGIVIEEIKKGYLLYGRVLRPAKVKVVK